MSLMPRRKWRCSKSSQVPGLIPSSRQHPCARRLVPLMGKVSHCTLYALSIIRHNSTTTVTHQGYSTARR